MQFSLLFKVINMFLRFCDLIKISYNNFGSVVSFSIRKDFCSLRFKHLKLCSLNNTACFRSHDKISNIS